MSVYQISSYVDIASIAYHLLTKKQIAFQYIFRITNIYIPIFVKKVLAEAPKFQLSKSK